MAYMRGDCYVWADGADTFHIGLRMDMIIGMKAFGLLMRKENCAMIGSSPVASVFLRTHLMNW